MRNFEERKAEVFRRSENRTKERKRNRNRILALCIPLCLILTVWSVMILPAMLPAGKDSGAEQDMEFNGSINDADGAEAKHIYLSVEVKGNDSDFYSEITDASGVTGVYENVFLAFEGQGAGNSMSGVIQENTSDGKTKVSADNSKDSHSYTITMNAADGSNRMYLLDNNILKDVTFNRTTILTDEQLANLKLALGLTN